MMRLTREQAERELRDCVDEERRLAAVNASLRSRINTLREALREIEKQSFFTVGAAKDIANRALAETEPE